MDDLDSGDELLERIRQGDVGAEEDLLRLVRPRLVKIIRARMDPRLRGRVDPSDVVQEALVDAHKHLDEYVRDRPLPLIPWLRKLAFNHLVDLHRQHVLAQKRSVLREAGRKGGGGFGSLNDEAAGELSDLLIADNTSPSLAARRKVLVTWGRFDDVHRWDLESGKPLGPPLSFPNPVTALSLSHDGKQLFIGTGSGQGALYETASGKLVGSLPHRPNLEPKRPHSLNIVFSTFSADGQRLLLSDAQGAVELRQLPGFALLSKMSRFQGRITTLDLLPCGGRAAIGCLDGSAAVWNLLLGQQAAQARPPAAQPGAAIMDSATIHPLQRLSGRQLRQMGLVSDLSSSKGWPNP